MRRWVFERVTNLRRWLWRLTAEGDHPRHWPNGAAVPESTSAALGEPREAHERDDREHQRNRELRQHLPEPRDDQQEQERR
jgi:hypothetical protein